ncbi:MAG: hypothetical protein GC129_04285 [Proteobacteria bacterium]|nr:hypothetical protein [Pseudomonadota bacterium]
MRIVQWNVWYKEDIAKVWETLRRLEPDVMCLQELTVNGNHNDGIDTAAYLQQQSGYHCFFRQAQQERKENGAMSGYGNAILSRLPFLKQEAAFIQPMRNPEAEVATYDNEGRLYLEVAVQDGRRVWEVGTTHMSYTHRFEETVAKTRETDVLLDLVSKKTASYVLTGDFNALPGAYTIERLSNVLVNVGPGEELKSWTTKPFSYQGFEANTLDWRLDYAFATPDVKVVRAAFEPVIYSDHLPLVVDVG